ncbi:hypothetical protein NFI96_021049 [Prochilodus magdalenae]|nr:hypothetical protein NFI96_021049 [Prochilodus magdalenae]
MSAAKPAIRSSRIQSGKGPQEGTGGAAERHNHAGANHQPAQGGGGIQDQSIHKPNEGCLEDNKADLMLPCFRRGMYEEPLSSYHSGSLISHLLRKTIHSKRPTLNSSHLYLPPASISGAGLLESGPTMHEPAQEDRSSMSSKDSLGESSSPGGHASGGMSAEPERPVNEHLQAKRARVENIIRGMAGSPSDRSHGEGEGVEGDTSRYGTEVFKESKRKRKFPQHQDHSPSTTFTTPSSANTSKDEECHKLREQLQSMQRLLRQLQEKFLQIYDHGNSENEEKGEGEFQEDINEAQLDLSIDSDNKRIGNKERIKADGSYLSSEKDQKNLQEMLKCELSRAVSESVDMVFRKLSVTLQSQSPQLQVCQSPEYTGVEKRAQQVCAPELSDSEDVPKCRPLEFYESTPAPSPEHQTEALSLVVRKPTLNQLNSVSQQVKRPYPLHQAPFQFSYSAPLHDSQILEHLLKYGPHASFGGIPCLPPSLDRTSPDSMDLPWESIAMRSKFNRCITSQLIKWFSNFREFYYIQMEKFARQAIVDGVSDVKDMAVTRDSELFRALNMHYNKANDFQVPDRFLEVAEITLHEFYNAISLNKDSDPSWKKAIYKVICKLDSDVPEEFKSPSYL